MKAQSMREGKNWVRTGLCRKQKGRASAWEVDTSPGHPVGLVEDMWGPSCSPAFLARGLGWGWGWASPQLTCVPREHEAFYVEDTRERGLDAPKIRVSCSHNLGLRDRAPAWLGGAVRRDGSTPGRTVVLRGGGQREERESWWELRLIWCVSGRVPACVYECVCQHVHPAHACERVGSHTWMCVLLGWNSRIRQHASLPPLTPNSMRTGHPLL